MVKLDVRAEICPQLNSYTIRPTVILDQHIISRGPIDKKKQFIIIMIIISSIC